jgi:hypothetical protein
MGVALELRADLSSNQLEGPRKSFSNGFSTLLVLGQLVLYPAYRYNICLKIF